MSTALLAVQTLNGLQLGVLLFLIAAGLTLVFGVMDFINLAHGVQYMLGAYFAVTAYGLTQNFLLALILALVGALAFGLLLEAVIFRHLYARDHLDQVLATFGVILFLTEAVRMIYGSGSLALPMPRGAVGRDPLDARPALSGLSPRRDRRRDRRRDPALSCSSITPASACCCAPAPRTRRWSRRSASISDACS